MKATNLAAIVLLSLVFFINCTPDSSVAPTTEDLLVKNSWSVDYYFHGQDMTSEFNPSTILFSTTGTAVYQKDGETIAGTWNKTANLSGEELITLNFNTSDAIISRLNDSWRVVDHSSNYFQFDESNGVLFRIRVQ
jgi:hypothetical protein